MGGIPYTSICSQQIHFCSLCYQATLNIFFLCNCAGVRPVLNGSQVVDVKYGVGLIEILRFDENSGRIHIKAWDRYVCIIPLNAFPLRLNYLLSDRMLSLCV